MTKEELEKEISILLSCNNCPENKGGYICQKEYEDKCLTQKIQYIKELQEEIAELKEDLRNKKLAIQNRNGRIKELEDENAELKDDNKVMADNLTKAKEIIRELLNSCFGYNSKTVNYEVKVKAGQFLKEV